MFKVVALISVLAVAVYCKPPPPTAEQFQAELVSAGVSSQTAAGIVAIAANYKSQFESAQSDPSAAKSAGDALHAEIDTYVKTQSTSDQKAYAAFVDAKKAQQKGQNATTPASK